jgi:hypothetical protein
MVLSFIGGYVPSHFGYGGGEVGLNTADHLGRAAVSLNWGRLGSSPSGLLQHAM